MKKKEKKNDKKEGDKIEEENANKVLTTNGYGLLGIECPVFVPSQDFLIWGPVKCSVNNFNVIIENNYQNEIEMEIITLFISIISCKVDFHLLHPPFLLLPLPHCRYPHCSPLLIKTLKLLLIIHLNLICIFLLLFQSVRLRG
jgi:hypothetical protein